MDIYQIIQKPVITEKATLVREKGNYYVFKVDRHASKGEIKNAIEKIFKVHVLKVNTTTLPGKAKRFGRSESAAHRFKKAVIKLKENEKIEMVEGV